MPLMSQAEFAREMGMDSKYIRHLNRCGRLVMKNGRVDSDASKILIERTRGNRPDLAERHRIAREAAAAARMTSGATKPEKNDPAPPQPASEPSAAQQNGDGDVVAVPPSYSTLNVLREERAAADSRLAQANARMKELELEERKGNLVAKSEVEFVLQDLGATLRAQLENMPDRLAPILLPLQTLEEVHAALVEEADEIGRAVSDQMRKRAERRAT